MRPLVEQLRRKQRVAVNPTAMEMKASTKMMLIRQHLSEFPNKLRPAITDAAYSKNRTRTAPGAFLSEVYEAAKIFFFGGQENFSFSYSHQPWEGLDKDTDTKDEAELVIRLFPWILKERQPRRNSWDMDLMPIYFLTRSENAISFVPLFAKLSLELGVASDKKPGWCGLLWSGASLCWIGGGVGYALGQLFINTHLAMDTGEEPSESFDRECLEALLQLREMGLVTGRSEHGLMEWCLEVANRRDRAFVESRLRLLISWNPTILSKYCKSRGDLLMCFHKYEANTTGWNFDYRWLEALVELGLRHHPSEVGFVFHKNCFSRMGPASPSNNFSDGCLLFGTEKVVRKIDETIATVIESNTTTSSGSTVAKPTTTTLRDLLFAAATNEDVALDGVYTIFRLDPAALVPDPIAPAPDLAPWWLQQYGGKKTTPHPTPHQLIRTPRKQKPFVYP